MIHFRCRSLKQIIFEDRRKGIVSRENFEWNKNDFCKEFKSTKNAVEFVEKFQSLTTFDRVQQIVLQNLPDPPPENPGNSQLEVSVPENGDPSTTRDNPQDDETTPEGDHIVDEPPSAKKQKTTDLAQMGADVASKKVGKLSTCG